MSGINRQGVTDVLKRTGLYSVGISAYDAIQEMRFRLASDTRNVTIGPANAEFWMTSRNEFGSLRNLPEEPIIEDLLREVRPDDVFYDIGANTGLYSCLVADVLSETVVAFEPEPNNAARLEENVQLNGSDVSVHRYALSDSSGEAEFEVTLDQIGPAGHSLVTGSESTSDTITVETVVGDELIAERDFSSPNVLKIDVEGAEMSVLRGLESTLASSECRLVYCELHRDRLRSQGHSADDVIAVLDQEGYEVSVPFQRDGEPFVRAKKE